LATRRTGTAIVTTTPPMTSSTRPSTIDGTIDG
jgi:hypothetical protein